jgi:hypothetical protein
MTPWIKCPTCHELIEVPATGASTSHSCRVHYPGKGGRLVPVELTLTAKIVEVEKS